jgi:hypothetical protein
MPSAALSQQRSSQRATPDKTHQTGQLRQAARRLYIEALWRYPVQPLAGAPLQEVARTRHGLLGARVVHGRNARGHVVTSRTKPPRLGLHGPWEALPREPLLDARPWQAPTAAEAGRRVPGARAHLVGTMRWSAAISSPSSGAPAAPVRSVGWLTVGCSRLSCWQAWTVWPSANDWGFASAWGRR